MHFIQTIILGIVEGLTEFLPISSTGHLLITEKLIGFQDPSGVFTVVIQLGAVLAASWYFKDDIITSTKLAFRGNKKARTFYSNVFIGLVPAGLVGFVLEATTGLPTSPIVIAVSLIVGGIILWLVENKYGKQDNDQPQGIEYGSITKKQAIIVGLSQCLSLIPGVSRSGSTIVSGMVSGMNRATATAFSFYLSIPLLTAASVLKIAKHHKELSQLPGGATQLVFGTLISALTAFLVVGWLLKYVSRNNLKPFAYYRIVLGIIILVLALTGYFTTKQQIS